MWVDSNLFGLSIYTQEHEMASSHNTSHPARKRRNSMTNPPDLSELRMVLLGKNSSEISTVGNFILGREAFDTEAPPPSVEQHSERAGGTVEGRYITLINTPHLFDPHLSSDELNQRVRESVSLCSPGPHVLALVLQTDDFTKVDRHRLDFILHPLTEEPLKHTLVVTTQAHQSGSSVDPDVEEVSQIIKECCYRCLEFHSDCNHKDLMTILESMYDENRGSHLQWEEFQDAPPAPEQQQTTNKQQTAQTESHQTQRQNFFINYLSNKKKRQRKLNLVLCGKSGPVRTSTTAFILGTAESILSRKKSSSVCVRREGEVCGCLITLVELPALYNTQLSEEKVMRETRRCVSLCDPGVHAFLLILPEGRLTDEDKGEVEKIQRVFGSRFSNHAVVIIPQQKGTEKDEATKSIMEMHHWARYDFDQMSQMSDLIELIKKLTAANKNELYTSGSYLEAQMQNVVTYKTENETLRKTVSELRGAVKNTPALSKSPDTLRIVLLGKTGVGKSATGNTILEKENVFEEDLSDESVTTLCQKETAEIHGRNITMIDTPGLFDTKVPNVEITKEITKCISMAAPGPHVFLLVLKVGQRFTQEEQETVKMIKDTFGQKSKMYTIVLFTRGDELKGKTIEQYVEKAGTELKKILIEFGNRYHVFNNNNKTSYTQVGALLEKIDSMVAVNGGSCYTNEMFQEVEKALQEEQERILKEREEEIEREKKELRDRYEAEIEGMRKEMLKQKERQEAEEQRREDEFKGREQQIKREMSEREQIQREDFKIRREEDERKMKECMEQINREREENRKQWEKQREEDQRRRDQEEKERRKKEEEWKKNQREEKEKFEREREEMIQKERAHQQKLQQEYDQKKQKEEKWRRDLEERIKQTEESKRKELLELQVSQQREWERKMQEENKKREEQEKEWKKRIASKEEDWNLQQIRKQKQFEWEKQKEKEQRSLKENERNEKEEQEKRRIEREANKKIRLMEEQLEAKREREEKERRVKDEQRRKEMEEQLQRQEEAFRREREEEEKIRQESEKRNLNFIKETHNKQMENLRIQTELRARTQAEEEFCAKLEEKVKEAKEEGFKEGCSKVESERTNLGRAVDRLVISVCGKKEDKKD